jgi:hypothetical protein
MAALKLRKFSNVEEVQFFLDGGILGGGKTVGGVYGLVGESITFTTPSATVTFVQGADVQNNTLTFAEIKAQIEAAITGSRVRSFGPDGAIGIIESTPTNGIALAATDQVAKKLLGFPQAAAVTGKVYKTPTTNTSPCLVAIYSDVQSNSHVVVTWE